MKKRVRRRILLVVRIASLALLYYLTARFGLELQAVSQFATYVWFPTGISLAALLLYGRSLLPGVMLGAFFANLATGAPYPVALGIAVGNSLEAYLGYVILKRFGFQNSLRRLKDVLLLIFFAATLSTVISATIGILSLYAGRVITAQSIRSTWIAWFIGDAISNLTILPFILVFMGSHPPKPNPKKVIELIGLIILLGYVANVVFLSPASVLEKFPFAYATYPPLIWAALRFGGLGAVTATLGLSLVASWGTAHNLGIFARADLAQSFFYLQSFMGITAFTSLIMASIVEERRALEARKDGFMSVASHELKTPLTSIKLLTQLLHKMSLQKKDVKAAGYLSRLDKQTDKLTALVNELLDVSKIQRNKLVLDKKLFSLQMLIKETVTTIKEYNQNNQFIIKGKVSKKIYGDPHRIEQVLINILSNAVKYAPHSKKIIISVKDKKQEVVVGVQDFGPGINPKYHKRIFERFFQVEDGDEVPSQRGGFGIGLYLSDRIIRQHGGRMWVVSKPGRGATFYFSLPFIEI